MFILNDVKAYRPDPKRPLILGLGNFDGLHLGHARILELVLKKAREKNGMAAILTFQNHPQEILHPASKPPLLTVGDYKLFLFYEKGIELCFWIPFTKDFSQIKAEDFVRDILIRQLQVSEVCMGFNAHFGHGREGTVQTMKKWSAKYGFDFTEVEPLRAAGDFISSSRIRQLVKQGEIETAAECLGRRFSLLAEVVKGDGRGAKLGFPTANLKTSSDVFPPKGVYPVKVRELEFVIQKAGGYEILSVSKPGPWRSGVLNWGLRPTFHKDKPKEVMEVYLLDFEGDLYGKRLEVTFYPRLRLEKPFENAENLKRQIIKDVQAARSYFAKGTVPASPAGRPSGDRRL